MPRYNNAFRNDPKILMPRQRMPRRRRWDYSESDDLVRAGNAIDEQSQGLGEVPEDLMYERMMRPPILSPWLSDRGAGIVIGPGLSAPPATNNYKSATYAFNATAVSQKVVPANPFRAYLLVQNNDAATAVFVNFGADAGLTTGVKIVAGGNFLFEGGGDGGVFVPSEDVYIVSAAGIVACIVMEGVAYTP